jgi:exodeoxyribonuclease VII small subunit
MSPKPSRKATPRGKAQATAPELDALPFEEALNELEGIVEELEDGSLPLEESLSRFERGIRLSKLLQKQLAKAEARVRKLVGQEGGEPQLEEMENEPEEEAEETDGSSEGEGNPKLPF